MDDIWMHFVEDLIDRVSGPMKFRLVMQPVMAAFFAIRSGLEDARAGKPPYFWCLRQPDSGEVCAASGTTSIAHTASAIRCFP